MSDRKKCPFCGAGQSYDRIRIGAETYRCGTSGPVLDENGEEAFNTGTECDKTCFSREVVRLSKENEELRAWKAEATAVLDEWEGAWIAAGKPGKLGASKARSTADEIDRLLRATAQ